MQSLKYILVLTSLVHFGSQLHAATQTQTITLDTANVLDSSSSLGDSDQSISTSLEDIEFVFDQFDTTLGTLNSATLEWSFSHSYSVTSSSLVTSDPTDEFKVEAMLSHGVDYQVDGMLFWGNGDGVGHDSNTADETVENTLMFSDTQEVGFFSSSIQGTGTFNFTIALGNGGDSPFSVDGYFTEFSVQRDAGAFATITYDYTPVPEPATYATLLGLAVLFYARLRKRR